MAANSGRRFAPDEVRERMCFAGSPYSKLERLWAYTVASHMWAEDDEGRHVAWLSDAGVAKEAGFSVTTARRIRKRLTGRTARPKSARERKPALRAVGDYKSERSRKAAETRSKNFAAKRAAPPAAPLFRVLRGYTVRRQGQVAHRGDVLELLPDAEFAKPVEIDRGIRAQVVSDARRLVEIRGISMDEALLERWNRLGAPRHPNVTPDVALRELLQSSQ